MIGINDFQQHEDHIFEDFCCFYRFGIEPL